MAGTQAKCNCGGILTVPAATKPQQPRAQTQPSQTAAPSSKIIIQCPKCGQKHQIDRSMAGTTAKCNCGAILQIPAPRTKQAPRAPQTPQAPRAPQTPRAQQTPQAPQQAPPAGVASLFDELTEGDWDRTRPEDTEEPEDPDRPTDDDVLASYTKDYKPPKQAPANLASRWKRLGGALLDGIIVTMVAGPVVFLTMGLAIHLLQAVPGMDEIGGAVSDAAASAPAPGEAEAAAGALGATIILASLVLSVVFSVIGWLLFLMVNGYFLIKRGQTIGKLVVGAKIVDVDSNIPGFTNVAVLRYLVPTLLAQLPFFGLIDALLIFGQERRCVHDYLAGTYVVNT